MAVNQADVEHALRNVIDPNTGRDFVAAKAVRKIAVDGDNVTVDVQLGYPAKSQHEILKRLVHDAVSKLPGVARVNVAVSQKTTSHAVQRGVKLIPGVKNIVAIASGKGGVGKSTTAVNLALALAAEGASVGVLDADIYGPSQPMMLGLAGRPESKDGKTLEPLEAYGVQAMSIGFLIDMDTPMVWRGPMVTQALEQLLKDTNWRDLDYLIVDMPPGTGDVALSLSQTVPVVGSIVVTTPQKVSLADSLRAVRMYQKLNIAPMGLVENMSYYACPNCHHESDIFGHGGGERLAEQLGIPFLGRLPVYQPIREGSDNGVPIVVSEPGSTAGRAFTLVAERTAAQVSILAHKTAEANKGKIPLIPVR